MGVRFELVGVLAACDDLPGRCVHSRMMVAGMSLIVVLTATAVPQDRADAIVVAQAAQRAECSSSGIIGHDASSADLAVWAAGAATLADAAPELLLHRIDALVLTSISAQELTAATSIPLGLAFRLKLCFDHALSPEQAVGHTSTHRTQIYTAPVTRQLQVNATKFPHGIRPLANYLATQGIGLGVYTDHGNGSCGYGPGSYGHYDLGAPPRASTAADHPTTPSGGSLPRDMMALRMFGAT